MKKSLSLVLALLLCLGAVSAMGETLGLGVATSIKSSKDASVVDGENYDGQAQVDTTICAVTLDDDGVIVNIFFDTAQTKVPFSIEGAILADMAAEIRSKVELGEDYGMRKASPIEAELFEQYASFEEYCVGKKADDIINMTTYERDENHTRVPEDEDLKTSVTIDVGVMLDALAKAVANAK